MNEPVPPPGLFAFQQAFSRHLRAPEQVEKPAQIHARQSRLYQTLLFNNVCGFIDRCFPVTKSLYSADGWKTICRSFYRDWASETPYFKQIPREFVAFINETKPVIEQPPWLAELVHYEWIELAAQTAPAQVRNSPSPLHEQATLAVNPTLHNLAYEWPVHTISAAALPQQPQATFVLVFRDIQHRVQFVEINQTTGLLVRRLQDHPCALGVALDDLASELGWSVDTQLQAFALELVNGLVDQQALYVADGCC